MTFQENSATSEQKEEATWNFNLSPSMLSIGVLEPEEMSLGKLHAFSQHLEYGVRLVQLYF